jgi:23S rRNA (guanosine2251-2'-O)-methyltransferase
VSGRCCSAPSDASPTTGDCRCRSRPRAAPETVGLSGGRDRAVTERRRGSGAPVSPKDTFITVYGRMPVLEVLEDRSLAVDKVVVADGARGANLDRIMELAAKRGVAVRTAPAQRIKLLAGNGKHDQGVVADVVAPQMAALDRRLETGPPLRSGVVVLDGITNPANVGMIIRTVTAAGLDGVVLPRAGSPSVDPLVIKASAGVAFRAPILRSRTAVDAVEALRAAGGVIYGLAGGAARSLYREDFPPASVFVLGNETAGVSPAVGALVDQWLSIPMAGGVESLNVSSAAAVVCFEVARRGGVRAAGRR